MVRFVFTLALLCASAPSALAEEATIDDALDARTSYQNDAQASQRRVEALDDETLALIARYNAELERHADLLAYNANLRALIDNQQRERQRLNEELEEIEVVRQDIVPLMLEMVEVLEDFIELDQPILLEERQARLEKLKSNLTRSDVELAEREQRFLEARNDRARLLEEISAARRAAEAEADRLRAEFERGEEALAELETELDEESGDLREVFNVVRQTAADVLPTLESSLVRAERKDGTELLDRLSGGEGTPTSADLRAIWVKLLEEMNESGRISRFETTVIDADGTETARRVTRVGTFAAVSNGEYLRYLPESGSLLVLPRQPAGVDPAGVIAFETAESPLERIAVDPSRGSILALVVQAPDVRERIVQGGIIGYIILALGALGLLLGLERLISTARAKAQLKRALAEEHADGSHAVDQLRTATQDPALRKDADALTAKLDEIVMVSAEKLRWGLPALAIFAAVSPLLGLLGTVTGMIETFQVITLFGAGDPRLMSGGISQALITTQLGLSVAIPLLLVHSFLQGRVNGLVAQLDETAAELFATGRVAAEATP